MNQLAHYFRKAQAWLSSKRYISQHGQWTPGGIVGAVIVLLVVLILLRAFRLI